MFILSGFYQPDVNNDILGGPEQMANTSAFLSVVTPIDLLIAENPEDVAGFVIIDNAFLASHGSSLSNILPTRDGLMIYKVQSGDTLSGIAAKFGISLNTVFWANPELNQRSVLRVGQELIVLPISGVAHEVKDGETLGGIAASYGVDPNIIIKHNNKISVGSTLIIPGVKQQQQIVSYQSSRGLPNLAGYFAIPTTGWNWGRLHHNNAVDIANACGAPIYASAEGLVIQVNSGWNRGYGVDVVIEHPNGVFTRYAHLQKSAVERGQFLVQGDVLGYMGNTGNTHGPTGCHLHFEVAGARNPFAK